MSHVLVQTVEASRSPSPNPEDDLAQDSTRSIFWTKPWYALGSQIRGDTAGELFMNENAVRARAGLLHITAWVVFCLLLVNPNPQFLTYTLGPVVGWDMLTASLFGLTPLSPYGILGTLLAWRAPPVWRPAMPKRFAWSLGVAMVIICVLLGQFRQRYAAMAVNVVCIALTWMEASLGFCLGCWSWNKFIVPMFRKEKCTSCEIPSAKPVAVARVKEIREITAQYPLVVFSKTSCPHCQQVKSVLKRLGADPKIVELDKTEDEHGYASALLELTGQTTVPNVFIGGQSVARSETVLDFYDEDRVCPILVEKGVPAPNCQQ
uniref:Glutaredoxin domain-containing protein n=1 Tax=Eutreptiella gymnastica TaxID=73025 RepID=A0A7S4G1C3_9EUGL